MKALKIGLVIVALAIAVYFYFVSTTKQYKKADVETSRMAPNLKPGLKRSTVENTLKANGFKINDTSPSKKGPVHRQIFVRAASRSAFSWVRYDVFIEYDGNDQLKTARFVRSGHSDGQEDTCVIMHEVPSISSVAYPIPCPANIQDF